MLQATETGDPQYVRGSYRVNLPDGRTQIVTYQVHPNEGYQATVTYEGTAKYPDNPGYVPSPYAPPIRSRTAKAISEKFKRQSKKTDYKQPTRLNDDFFAEVYGESRIRSERKLPDHSSLDKVLEKGAVIDNKEESINNDLQQAPSQNSFSAPLYREKVPKRKRKKVLKVKMKSVFSTEKLNSHSSVSSISSPAPTRTIITSPSTVFDQSSPSFIGPKPKPIPKKKEVFLPKFVHLVTPTYSSTTLPPSTRSVESNITPNDEAELNKENNLKPITEAAEVSFFTPSLPALQSPISTSSSSPLDYDIENLKEIEIIGNTVTDDDEEYFEDYYNFPFGSRITSFISSQENASKSRSINVAVDDPSDDIDEKKDVNDVVIDEDVSAATTASYSPVHEDDIVRLVAARSGNTFVPEHYTN